MPPSSSLEQQGRRGERSDSVGSGHPPVVAVVTQEILVRAVQEVRPSVSAVERRKYSKM